MIAFLVIDPLFWITLPGFFLALWAQSRLGSIYKRYSRIGTTRNLTGAQAARLILDRSGCGDVGIHAVRGHLTDHYDPAKRAVFLSDENYHSTSVAAVGVAAHEVGHAIQHRTAYAPLNMRMALVGVTQFASNGAWLAIMGGLALATMSGGEMGRMLLLGGILLFCVTVLFQVITLPVEYDASRRARVELERLGLVTTAELPHVGRVLNAAALTYVAALVTSMLNLLWILLRFISLGGDDR